MKYEKAEFWITIGFIVVLWAIGILMMVIT
ncbi:hypothetical protein LCGC14_0720400 [marine sediment metagenome]|uniref:Uncharacterized protein n=1 Tax=marine sediment metagenome TaxID=412755 RepID=A0A0F9QXK0_9ZZZZ